MTIEKLKRVMWRLRAKNPGVNRPSYAMLERAIMWECGTSRMTYFANKAALIKLQWITGYNHVRFTLTNKDLEE
jgi:hypothetical protein